jgi:hypothetical protein
MSISKVALATYLRRGVRGRRSLVTKQSSALATSESMSWGAKVLVKSLLAAK